MKIALVSPYDYAHPSGVNLHVSALADGFTRTGHEVNIIVPSSRPHETQQNCNITTIGKPIPIRASGSIVRIPISPWHFFSHRIKKILEQERFDVIHIHEPFLPVLSTSVLHHCSNETLNVGTFHAFRNNSWGYWFWRPVLKKWAAKLDGKIAVSQPAKEFVSKYFPGDYTIIPNGIDLKRFSDQLTPIEKYSDNKLNILFVGRPEKRKGLKYLLSAYEMVKKEMPQSRLIIIGPAPSRVLKKYQEYVSERNLQDVVFTGYVSNEDLPCYYKTADVFCSPATGKESFGLILLEAMATAKPIVASNMGGYASLIKHGEEGLLVEPKDENALACALIELLGDKSLRDKMGEKGKIKAQDYSWEKVTGQVLVYYDRLLAGSSCNG
ncbi:glycosyltransferase family 4 protein [Chloroflexota bacterium]